MMDKISGKWFISYIGDLHNTDKPGWASRPIRRNYARTHRNITCVRELAATLRAGEYAWPGGYQMAFITSDGGLLCFECVRAEYSNVIWSIKNKVGDGWRVIACDILYEAPDGPEYCSHCNKILLEEDE